MRFCDSIYLVREMQQPKKNKTLKDQPTLRQQTMKIYCYCCSAILQLLLHQDGNLKYALKHMLNNSRILQDSMCFDIIAAQSLTPSNLSLHVYVKPDNVPWEFHLRSG